MCLRHTEKYGFITEDASDAFRVLFRVLILWQHKVILTSKIALHIQTLNLVFVYMFEQ